MANCSSASLLPSLSLCTNRTKLFLQISHTFNNQPSLFVPLVSFSRSLWLLRYASVFLCTQDRTLPPRAYNRLDVRDDCQIHSSLSLAPLSRNGGSLERQCGVALNSSSLCTLVKSASSAYRRWGNSPAIYLSWRRLVGVVKNLLINNLLCFNLAVLSQLQFMEK